MSTTNLIGRNVVCTRPDFGLDRDETYTIVAHDGSFVGVEDSHGHVFGFRETGDFAGRPTIGLDRFRFCEQDR